MSLKRISSLRVRYLALLIALISCGSQRTVAEQSAAYSSYANRTFPDQVFWGDSHLHTSMSMDAGTFGARLLPDDAYRFAKGYQLTSTTGVPARLSRPLDWLVVSDHSNNMGFFPALLRGDEKILASPQGRRWYDMVQEGGQTAVAAALEIVIAIANKGFDKNIYITPGTKAFQDAWAVATSAADAHNDPGQFTAFIGYEWTSTDNGQNLHRVVIYRDGEEEAAQLDPYTSQAPEGSPDPRELWKWLAHYEDVTGGQILAIPHNGNLSNGHMFPTTEPLYGGAIDAEWASTRARWEPLYEITQIKGDGEAHPFLSPDDEFADYETWDVGNLDLSEEKTDDMLIGEYGRTALQLGLQIEQKTGVNPYKFGFVGATDSHTALATGAEDNFFGKHSGAEPSPERLQRPMAKLRGKEVAGWSMVASGYQGIWATENTREALFDAMRRKETYATTGSRITVRFFGGWDFMASDAMGRLPHEIGYAKGVPMGGDLAPRGDHDAPTFLVAAQRDPYSGNLDRIQIVKGWVDASGQRHEQIHNVAWSDDRILDAQGRLPPVGNTVDVATATWTNAIGSPELMAVWKDPDFDPEVSAVYYARVLEIPTPRWSTHDAARYGTSIPPDAPTSTQERAYTSAIWYTP